MQVRKKKNKKGRVWHGEAAGPATGGEAKTMTACAGQQTTGAAAGAVGEAAKQRGLGQSAGRCARLPIRPPQRSSA
jgi:hypothetical protein